MSFFSRGIVVTIGLLLLILVVFVISLTLVLGIAVGLGWLVVLVLPFTLFEATLLVLVALIPIGLFWHNMLASVTDFAAEPYDDYEEFEEYEEYEIPATRFFKTEQDKTWEAWFRFQIANSIYDEFQVSPQPVAPMGDKQLQELAIRLADTAMSLLKAKTARAKRFTVTLNVLKRQMTKAGQRPYDDNILQLAVEAINETLDFHEYELRYVIQNKLWDSRYELF